MAPEAQSHSDITKYYNAKITNFLRNGGDDSNIWKLGEDLIQDAFRELKHGSLSISHLVCTFVLGNTLVKFSHFHEACAHAILSTSHFETELHACQAYIIVADNLSLGCNTFKEWSNVFGYLAQASWGLSGFIVKKQWEQYMAEYLTKEEERRNEREEVQRQEDIRRKQQGQEDLVDVRSLHSYRKIPHERDRIPRAHVVGRSRNRLPSVDKTAADDTSPIQSDRLHSDWTPRSAVELPSDIDHNCSQENAVRAAEPPVYDTRFNPKYYDDENFQYEIYDIQDYNAQVAAARLVNLKKPVASGAKSFDEEHELNEGPSASAESSYTTLPPPYVEFEHVEFASDLDKENVPLTKKKRFEPELLETTKSPKRKSRSTTFPQEGLPQVGTSWDGAQDQETDVENLTTVLSRSVHTQQSAAPSSKNSTENSPATQEKLASVMPRLYDDNAGEGPSDPAMHTGRKNSDVPSVILITDTGTEEDVDIDDCSSLYDDDVSPANVTIGTGRTEDVYEDDVVSLVNDDDVGSDFESEAGSFDSDEEVTDTWDAMYNHKHCAQARFRLDTWIMMTKQTKGEPPELYDQIIYFLRSLRKLWQDNQSVHRGIGVEESLRKKWRHDLHILIAETIEPGCRQYGFA